MAGLNYSVTHLSSLRARIASMRMRLLSLPITCVYVSACLASANCALAASLPDWSGVKLVAWQYQNPFFPSAWGEAKLGDYAWKSENTTVEDGKLLLSVDEQGSAQVQTSAEPLAGFWEVDVTLPRMVPGLVAAPLWLMSQDPDADEIDFEFVGSKGLTITAWAKLDGTKKNVWSKGVDNPLVAGDLSGRHFRLAINYVPGKFVEWYLDGALAARITPADTQGHFPSLPMRPYFDLWVAKGTDPGWAGQWQPLAAGQKLTLTVEGYRYSHTRPEE